MWWLWPGWQCCVSGVYCYLYVSEWAHMYRLLPAEWPPRWCWRMAMHSQSPMSKCPYRRTAFQWRLVPGEWVCSWWWASFFMKFLNDDWCIIFSAPTINYVCFQLLLILWHLDSCLHICLTQHKFFPSFSILLHLECHESDLKHLHCPILTGLTLLNTADDLCAESFIHYYAMKCSPLKHVILLISGRSNCFGKCTLITCASEYFIMDTC